MIQNDDPCLCGSTKIFGECCGAILDDHSKAETAEQLMRSRYTGFALQHNEHLLRSWSITTRPNSLNHDDHPVTWIGLEVHGTTDGQIGDDIGEVEFTARYIENSMLCKLREKSSFQKVDDLWYYLNGECEVKKEKLDRNAPCLCGSGKKFKKCCY